MIMWKYFWSQGIKPMVIYCELDLQEQTSGNFLYLSKYNNCVLKVITIGWSHLQSASNKPLKISILEG